MSVSYKDINTSVGLIRLLARENALIGVLWSNNKQDIASFKIQNDHPVLCNAEEQLQAYLKGERTAFTLPIKFQGTPFQNEVWKALTTIHFGTTMSYEDIAKKIARPKAVRAVGTAIGKNPLAIILPCHRVIGKNGKLTGFAGGLENKKMLLALESQKFNQV